MADAGPTGIVKRSVSVAGHRTSVSLEPLFWDILVRLARERGLSVQALVAQVDAARGARNLSSALRVYVLEALIAPTEGRPSESAGLPPASPPA